MSQFLHDTIKERDGRIAELEADKRMMFSNLTSRIRELEAQLQERPYRDGASVIEQRDKRIAEIECALKAIRDYGDSHPLALNSPEARSMANIANRVLEKEEGE